MFRDEKTIDGIVYNIYETDIYDNQELTQNRLGAY